MRHDLGPTSQSIFLKNIIQAEKKRNIVNY